MEKYYFYDYLQQLLGRLNKPNEERRIIYTITFRVKGNLGLKIIIFMTVCAMFIIHSLLCLYENSFEFLK